MQMQNEHLYFFYAKMSRTKKFLAIRIICFALSGLLLSSSVIMSNQKTIFVEASGVDELDVVKAALYLSLCVFGIVTTVSSGGLTAPAFIEFLLGGVSFVDTVQDYIEDNGDGTYTIKAELIQSMKEATESVESSMFGDAEYSAMFSGDGYTYELYTYGSYLNPSNNITYTHTFTGSVTEKYPICAVYFSKESTGLANSSIQLYKNSSMSAYSMVCKYVKTGGGNTTTNKSTFSFSMYDQYEVHTSDYALNFPIFSNVDDAKAYLTDGSGYEKALNYTDTELFEYSSYYTGAYSGGDITISAAKLNGITSKIDELNATELSTDEKIDKILEYLEEDEDSGDDGGGDSGDDEEDEDKPTTILEWLEKINDNLKDILKQVKQIKWLSVADLIDDIIFNLIELKNDFEPVVQTMSEKFPFSLPWDTVLIFSLLSDSPETPYYEIPFVIPSAGIDEVLIVDLARFEKLSKISRFLLTLTFLLMLFALTRKIAHWLGNNKN